MSEPFAGSTPMHREDDEITLFAIASVLLRYRRTIIVAGLIGGTVGLIAGLLTTRVYVSSATFLPQTVDVGSAGGIAVAASQLGIRVPTSGGGWGPPVYAQLLRSREVLDPIALDSVVVAEDNGRRVAFADLVKARGLTREARIASASGKLKTMVGSREVKALGAVEVQVTTPWPSVSLALAQRLVQGVNRFNLQTRQSQAVAEREFVNARVTESERALRDAENRLQSFLQGNRVTGGSPELTFERDRLQRDVTLRQQLYTSLLQNLEEARIREIRDTPVITVLDSPRLPLRAQGRKTVTKAIAGGLLGAGLAALIVFLLDALTRVKRGPSAEAKEFFALVDQSAPQFLRRRRS